MVKPSIKAKQLFNEPISGSLPVRCQMSKSLLDYYMKNRIVLSLLLIANVSVAGSVTAAKQGATSKQNQKVSFLRPEAAERSHDGFSIGGAIDGLIGFLYFDTIIRRGYELANFWSWAQELDRTRYRHVYAIVGSACEQMNVPMPDLYVINHADVNAKLWTGKINAVVYGWSSRYAAITITQDALDMLNQDELEAYLTQAVSQIKHRYVRLHYMLSSFLQCNPYYSLQLTRNSDPRYRRNPIMAALITLGGQAWLRSRIDDADRTAAHHLKKPAALASAIAKENEHAGLPYKVGSAPVISLLNNWPTAADRIETVEKIRRQRKDD